MHTQTQRKRKFYPEDLVHDVNTPDKPGLVLKTWQDDELPDNIILPQLVPGLDVLEEGQILIHYIASGPTVIHEDTLCLVDRTFQAGDCCKRAADEIQSGVVITTQCKGLLEHAINKEPVPGWKTMQDVEIGNKAQIGDYVVHGDWIGEVVEVFDETLVETGNGRLLTIPELRSPFAVGDTGHDILPKDAKNIIATLATSVTYDKPDIVLEIRHTIYAISWLALNQMLSLVESQSRVRPKRFWYGEDLSELARLNNPCASIPAGAIVWLKDAVSLPKTFHVDTTDPTTTATITTYAVRRTQTTVTVLWQDGTHETLSALELVPQVTVDEHDCWPGDHVVWKSEDQARSAVVQKVYAADRTADVLFSDSSTVELVSLLELDPHSSADSDPLGIPDEYGVRQGDIVFVHAPGCTNGLEPPRVPRIGILEPWAKESPQFDEHLEATGWRKEMLDLGSTIITKRATGTYVEGRIKDTQELGGVFNWLGHVTYLNLDGTVEVTHPDNTKATYHLERLTKLCNTMDQLDDLLDYDDVGSDEMHEDNYYEVDRWLDDAAMDEDSDSAMQSSDEMEVEQPLQGDEPTLASNYESPSSPGHDDKVSGVEDDSRWKRFDLLPSAPMDHAFFSSSPAQPSKKFLGRLHREYNILTSSLPDTILVRAYEDRTDLLRSLIIGPDNTPYEDAPFVIDWQLDSNFPNSPPLAHFHSWTSGNGRVNPNLYEEGKVCLSILGTWQGDHSESWSAARSSLLQAFVSIQGLVLVKEPWYCEPGYDKMRGTDDALINSRLYSEKAFVLSRGFVRRALEVPVGGFEAELNWMYFYNRRLERVISKARSLIETSKSGGAASQDPDAAIPLLTAGGIILLERTLSKLQMLLNKYEVADP